MLNKLAILSAARLQYCGQVGEVIPGLRKWAFFCVTAAAAAIVGCGGSSHSSSGTSTSSTTGTTTLPGAATVKLPTTYGLVYTGFITGAGRAQGDLYMNIEQIILNDSYSGTSVYRQQTTPIVIQLPGYSFQMATIDVALAGKNSELFDSATFIPYTFAQEQAGGFVGLNLGQAGVLAPLPQNAAAVGQTSALYADISIQPSTRLRTFPGRDTVLPLFLDQTMFAEDATLSYVGLVPDSSTTFNASGPGQTIFQDVNQPANTSDSTTSGKIAGYLSDMVQISLASVPSASLPHLRNSDGSIGVAATDLYLSGDRYAVGNNKVSQPTSSNPNFQELTLDPTQPIFGLVGQPGTVISSQFQFGGFPGTYDLTQLNPTDLTGESRLTSLFGRWRPITSLMNLTQTTFDLVIFPNSNESYSANSPADVLAIVHSGNTVKNVYIGSAYFTGGTKGAPAMAQLYPLNSFVDSATTTGEVDFKLSNFLGASGGSTTDEPSIRNGNFTATSATVPAGFSKSGTFVVFRQ